MDTASTRAKTDAWQNDFVPPPRKPRTAHVEAAIVAALVADEALRDHDEARRGLLEARAVAIQVALDNGATFAELGQRFGLDPSRIHQMAQWAK